MSIKLDSGFTVIGYSNRLFFYSRIIYILYNVKSFEKSFSDFINAMGDKISGEYINRIMMMSQ